MDRVAYKVYDRVPAGLREAGERIFETYLKGTEREGLLFSIQLSKAGADDYCVEFVMGLDPNKREILYSEKRETGGMLSREKPLVFHLTRGALEKYMMFMDRGKGDEERRKGYLAATLQGKLVSLEYSMDCLGGDDWALALNRAGIWTRELKGEKLVWALESYYTPVGTKPQAVRDKIQR